MRKLRIDDSNEHVIEVSVIEVVQEFLPERKEHELVTWEAHIKWDGCVNLWHFPEEEREYFHICDLYDFRDFIEALIVTAEEHLGHEHAWRGHKEKE